MLAAASLTFSLVGCGSAPEGQSAAAAKAAAAKSHKVAEDRLTEDSIKARAEYDAQMAVAQANTAAAVARLEAAKATIADTDQTIASAQALNAEDPPKMQRLIEKCMSELGVSMTGPGSIQIMKCVENRW